MITEQKYVGKGNNAQPNEQTAQNAALTPSQATDEVAEVKLLFSVPERVLASNPVLADVVNTILDNQAATLSTDELMTAISTAYRLGTNHRSADSIRITLDTDQLAYEKSNAEIVYTALSSYQRTLQEEQDSDGEPHEMEISLIEELRHQIVCELVNVANLIQL